MRTVTASFAISLLTLLAACSDTYTEPATGAQRDWSFDDNAPREKKEEAYKVLKLELGVNRMVLKRHENSPVGVQSTIKLCQKNIEDIEEAMRQLRLQGIGG